MIPRFTLRRGDSDGPPSPRKEDPEWWTLDTITPAGARKRARTTARVLGLAFVLWLPVAAILVATFGLLDVTDTRTARSLLRRQSSEQLEVAARLVRGRLSSARADLALLSVSTLVERYVRDPAPSRLADLRRELLRFTTYRPWCTGVRVVVPDHPPVLTERESTGVQCPSELIGAVQTLPASEALLGHTRDVWPSGRLCLGLPMEGPPRGIALLAEIDPAVLFADLDSLLSGPLPTVFDGSGNHVAGPAPRSPDAHGPSLAVGLPGWHGPSAGTWHVASAPSSTGRTDPAAWMLHLDRLLGGALLLLLATAALAVARLVEAHRRAQVSLRRQIELLQLAIETSPTPLFLTDATGAFRLCNTACASFLGRPREAVLGQMVSDLLPAEMARAHVEVDASLLREGGTRRYEARATGAGAGPRDVVVVKTAVCDAEGRPVGVTGALVDVTAAKATAGPPTPGPEAAPRPSEGPAQGHEAPPPAATADVRIDNAEPAPRAASPLSGNEGAGAASSTAAVPETPQRRPGPWRALVVEDNRVNQRVASVQLQRLGGEVDLAANGLEAVEAASRRRYDIVFMDCRMPEHDGYDATRRIRAHEGAGTHVPIVALTANAMRGDRERCLASGMTDYLPKPIDHNALRQVVERYVLGGPAPLADEGGPDRNEDAVVDVETLARLRALDSGGNELLGEIARDFEEGFRQRLAEMQTAIRRGDGALLESAAHSLKGSAGILGARALVTLSRTLEDLGRRGRVAEGGELLGRVTREHETLMSVLSFALAAVPDSVLPSSPGTSGLPSTLSR